KRNGLFEQRPRLVRGRRQAQSAGRASMRQGKLPGEMLVDIPGSVDAGRDGGLEKIDTGLPRLRFKSSDYFWGTPKRAKNGAFEIDLGDGGL
ncbi:MAG: hypothetical protein WBS14_11875, partial [Rhodomicrobium sp.]